ncbi:hypothetical protein [Micromonospora sp. NPDC047730]|uniref:hypothetical protein n=1 Tax=Micromonospora sp. NPDC047730 TaxID=3364253 RepID=UPI003710CB53
MSRRMKADEPLYRAAITATYPPSRWRDEEWTETVYVGPYTSTGPASRAVTVEVKKALEWGGATSATGHVERAPAAWERIE